MFFEEVSTIWYMVPCDISNWHGLILGTLHNLQEMPDTSHKWTNMCPCLPKISTMVSVLFLIARYYFRSEFSRIDMTSQNDL